MSRLRVLTLIMYVLLIFFLSSRPYLHSPGPDFELKDKLVHLVEYLILGLLLIAAAGRLVCKTKAGTFLLFLAIGASIAALDEVLQNHVPGRSMDVYDWVADVLGVAVGVGLFVSLTKGAKTRIPAPANPDNTGAKGDA